MLDTITAGILSTSTIAPTLSASTKDSPEKIKDAATQFESLLLGQILKSVHEDDGEGWLGTEDQTAGAALGMADEYFAKAMAAHGGVGLAKAVAAGLKQASSSE